MRGAHYAVALASIALVACGSNRPSAATEGDAGSDGEVDPEAQLTPEELAALGALSPTELPRPGPDSSNRFSDDPRAAAFGQKLFFETAFAGKLLEGDDDGSPATLGVKGQTGKVACAGCHVADAGFLDNRSLGRQVSLAAGWGRRRAPSLLDVAQAKLLMWDGRHDALYNQPFGPLESPIEMNGSRLFTAEQIHALYRTEYEAIFGAMPALDDASRFPQLSAEKTGCQPSTADTPPTCNGATHGMPGDGAEYDHLTPADQIAVTQVVVNMGKAIGAYERLLSCGPGRFDQWMHGTRDALSRSEQRGAQIFVGRGRCNTCHSGPFLSDQQFYNVGLQPKPVAVVFIDADDHGASAGLAASMADPLNVRGRFSDGDDGRLSIPVDARQDGAFRTPILRCQARRPSFMHTGQLRTLDEVVAFFARGGDAFGYPGKKEILPLSLTAQDQRDLVAFLGTLEGPGPAPSLLKKPLP